MRHKFQSIKDKGGLKIHLNETKALHNGLGYKTFRLLKVAGLNTTNMARAFKVTFETMKEWRAIDEREQEERRKADEAAMDEMHERLK